MAHFEEMAPLETCSPLELEGISDVIASFLELMQHERFRPPPEEEQEHQAALKRLKRLHQRLLQQQYQQSFLAIEDLQDIRAALHLFALFLALHVPPSGLRQKALDILWNLQSHLLLAQKLTCASLC